MHYEESNHLYPLQARKQAERATNVGLLILERTNIKIIKGGKRLHTLPPAKKGLYILDSMDVVPTSQVGTGECRVFDGRPPNVVVKGVRSTLIPSMTTMPPCKVT